MIIYFADRAMNILGSASTGLPKGLMITDDKKTEEISEGVATFECNLDYDFANSNKDEKQEVDVKKLAAVGNFILKQSADDGKAEVYTIIDSTIDPIQKDASIYAEDAGLDLLNEVVGTYTADKAYSIDHYINKFAYDSGFEIGINEVSNLTRKLSWDGEATATERLLSVATQFDNAEIEFSFKVENMAVTGKYINVYKKRGNDSGVTLTIGKEVSGFRIKSSIADLATAYRCTGGTPEGSENPITLNGYKYDDGDFYVEGSYVKSRKALEKWSRYQIKTEKKENDVTKVEETWWYRFIHEHGFQLERNNSYSGSTVCHTGYEKADYSDRSFITRIHNLGTPDIILVFGGTNDSWAGAPIGAYQYDGWTKADLYSFRPAFCYLLASLKQLYPAARIYNITNSELSEEVTDSMDEICRHYGIENIRLHDIDKQWGHPSVQGMQSIDAQVWESVSPILEASVSLPAKN